MTNNNTMKKIVFHYTKEQLKRYIIDVYEKNSNGEWVLLPYAQIDTDTGLYDVVNGEVGYWDSPHHYKFTPLNMDLNSATCGRCYKINRTYQKDRCIVSNETILEFMIGGSHYYIEKQTYSTGKHRQCYTIKDNTGDFAVNDFSYTKKGIMKRFKEYYEKDAIIINQTA